MNTDPDTGRLVSGPPRLRFSVPGSGLPGLYRDVRNAPLTCDRPPAGWFCTLPAEHTGPCPTRNVAETVPARQAFTADDFDLGPVPYIAPRRGRHWLVDAVRDAPRLLLFGTGAALGLGLGYVDTLAAAVLDHTGVGQLLRNQLIG